MTVNVLTVPMGLPQARWSLQTVGAVRLRPPTVPYAAGVTRTWKAVAWERVYGLEGINDRSFQEGLVRSLAT